jgi:hypothetical protein
VVDLDYPPFFVDRVEDAVPPGPQAPQIRRPVRERLRRPRLTGELADGAPERRDTDGIVAEEARRLVQGLNLSRPDSSPGWRAQAAARLLMRHVADRPGLAPGQVPGPGSVELLVDLLLLHRLAQPPVLLNGHHHHRYHLAATTNHVVGVTAAVRTPWTGRGTALGLSVNDWWGGWGSNPRPADMRNTGPTHRAF